MNRMGRLFDFECFENGCGVFSDARDGPVSGNMRGFYGGGYRLVVVIRVVVVRHPPSIQCAATVPAGGCEPRKRLPLRSKTVTTLAWTAL